MRPPSSLLRFCSLSILLIVIALPQLLVAHDALIEPSVTSNGKLQIRIATSDGESPGGSLILREKETGRPLATVPVPDSGDLLLDLPTALYTITLDMGEGHTVVKTGPMPEQTAPSPEQITDTVKSTVNAIVVTRPKLSAVLMGVGGVLVLLSILVGYFNSRSKLKR